MGGLRTRPGAGRTVPAEMGSEESNRRSAALFLKYSVINGSKSREVRRKREYMTNVVQKTRFT